MGKYKILYPVLATAGVMVFIGGVASALYWTSQNSLTEKMPQQVELPHIGTDSLDPDKHVVVGHLEVSEELTVQGDAKVDTLTADSIVLGQISDELREGQLFRAADGSLRYYDGKRTVTLGASAGTLQPTIGAPGIPGPSGPTGPAGSAGADGVPGLPGVDGADGGMDVVAILAGQGVLVTDNDGTITIAAPGAGTCPGCADTSLSNLSGVALNASLVPDTDGAISLGDSSSYFQNGYMNNVYTQNIYASSIDNASAGPLSLGAANATSINLAQDTLIAADKSLTANGAVLFQNATNSALAFQVQQANGTSVLRVDTTNGRVGIGSAAPAHKLSVNTLTATTGNTTAQVAVGTLATGNKGLVIQGVSGQTANLFEVQNSAGTSVVSISPTGAVSAQAISTTTLTAGTATVNGATALRGTATVDGAATFSSTALFQNTIDSAQAFQIKKSDGLSIFNADTEGGTISIGSSFEKAYMPGPKTNYTTGTTPRSLTSADINGDGSRDMVVGNYASNTVSVLINNGDGTFAPKVDYGVGAGPYSVTSADLNGDGYQDVMAANLDANTVSVLINNGNGTFTSKVDYLVGTRPTSVTSADLNGDGYQDVMAANLDANTVSVLINNGDGTFAPKVDYGVGDNPFSATSADINGDGSRDMVVGNYASNTVSVLINNGNGTFTSKVDYLVGTRPNSITSADLNGDGYTDLATANNTDTSITNTHGSVSVLINNGDGTFAPKVDYGVVGAAPRSITSADLNGDGYTDLATANPSGNKTILAFINNGNGTFALPIDFVAGNRPWGITAGDFNGDNVAELAVVNDLDNTVSVFVDDSASGPLVKPKLIVTTSKSAVGQVIKGASGQTADLLQVKDSESNTLHSIGATGSVLFKNSIDSVDAFRVQQANGTSVFGVDTTNGRIGIGTIIPANKLSVNDLTTTDTLAQFALGTAGSSNKGVVIQGVANQTADLLQAQDSTGAVLASINATGKLTVTSVVVTVNLTVNGHIVTGGEVPTVVADLAACTDATEEISGNDSSGTVTITTGTGCTIDGVLAKVSFNKVFDTAPRITLTPNNANASRLQLYSDAASTADFTISTTTVPTDATVYKFNYWTVQ